MISAPEIRRLVRVFGGASESRVGGVGGTVARIETIVNGELENGLQQD